METVKTDEGLKSLIIPDTVAHELWKTEKEYDPTIWLDIKSLSIILGLNGFKIS